MPRRDCSLEYDSIAESLYRSYHLQDYLDLLEYGLMESFHSLSQIVP